MQFLLYHILRSPYLARTWKLAPRKPKGQKHPLVNYATIQCGRVMAIELKQNHEKAQFKENESKIRECQCDSPAVWLCLRKCMTTPSRPGLRPANRKLGYQQIAFFTWNQNNWRVQIQGSVPCLGSSHLFLCQSRCPSISNRLHDSNQYHITCERVKAYHLQYPLMIYAWGDGKSISPAVPLNDICMGRGLKHITYSQTR